MSVLLFVCFLLCGAQGNEHLGTTLFTRADLARECWSSEHLALLTSRMILEDLLPSTSVLVIDSNEFVNDLVEYFRLVLEIVREETQGKVKHITLVALADLLGGYLHYAVLPLAKYGFYAGVLDYESVGTLLELFDELKCFLRTNGQGWTVSLTQHLENIEIQKLPLQSLENKADCENLIFLSNPEAEDGDFVLPLPFFDSVITPSTVALPLNKNPLYNLEANSSCYLLLNFFITAYKCLELKNARPENRKKFERDFDMWLEIQVLPRLNDEKFYTAFGGILRVKDTLSKLGLSEMSHSEHVEEPSKISTNDTEEMSKSSVILVAILVTIFVWFLFGSIYVCYKMRLSKLKGSTKEDSESKDTSTCSSLSTKNLYARFKKGKKRRDSTSQDSDWSDSDRGFKKRHLREITIKTCHCQDDEDEDGTTAVLDSVHTEGRLPSITEISEQTTTDKRSTKGGNLHFADDPKSPSKVQKQVYLDTESDTEDTSEPG